MMRPLAGKMRDVVSISCLTSMLCNPSPWRSLHTGIHSILRSASPVAKALDTQLSAAPISQPQLAYLRHA